MGSVFPRYVCQYYKMVLTDLVGVGKEHKAPPPTRRSVAFKKAIGQIQESEKKVGPS